MSPTPVSFRHLALLLWLAFSGSLYAQSELRVPFHIGDVFERKAYALERFDPGPDGSAQVWDFSQLEPLPDQDLQVSILAPGQTPGSASFPGATLCEQSQGQKGTTYRYWQQGETELRLLGMASVDNNGVTLIVPQSLSLFALPLRLGNAHSDNFSASIQADGQPLERSGTLNVHADASGTLLLPQGRLAGALRVAITQSVTQASLLPGQPQHLDTRSVIFYTPGCAFPVFSLSEEIAYSPDNSSTHRLAYVTHIGKAGPATRWLAHLASAQGSFSSEVLLRNNGSQTNSIWLTPITASGQSSATRAYTLSPGAQLRLSHADLGTNTSHLALSAGEQISATVTYQAANGGASAHLNTSEAAREFLIYRGDWALLFDGLALVNLSNTAARITAELLDDSGTVLGPTQILHPNLAPSAKLLVNLADAFKDASGRLVRVRSDGDAAAVFLRGSHDGRYLYPNEALKGKDAGRRWLPHLTTYGGDFVSEALLHNNANASATVTLQPYTAGQNLAPLNLTLAAHETRVLSHEQLDTRADSLAIDGPGSVIASVGHRARLGGSTAQIHESLPARAWLIWPGEWQLLWDGLAAVNTSTTAARFSATVLDEEGNPLTTLDLGTRGANQKWLEDLARLLAAYPNRLLRLSADQDAAVSLIRASRDGRYLYPNSPL